jgi:uncharacterized heparinase superfamily protein
MTDTGFYTLRDGKPFVQETSLTIRCGPMGFGPLCAHAHADMLSFVLNIGGYQFIIDPGTYAYHLGGQKWRQFFRGTKAHNTLVMHDTNQAESGGAMIWLSKVIGHATQWKCGKDQDLFGGWHEGYQHNRHMPATHYRQVILDRAKGVFEVRDRIAGQSPLEVALYYHFHPRVAVNRLEGNCFLATRDGESLLLEADHRCAARLVAGDSQSPQGWYSPYFTIKVPTTTLILSHKMISGNPLLTRFHFGYPEMAVLSDDVKGHACSP